MESCELLCTVCKKRPMRIEYYEKWDGGVGANISKLCRKCQLKARVDPWTEKAYEKYPFLRLEEN